ncbi:MAG: alpha/beta hydrolase domain-containing protein [bacterium]
MAVETLTITSTQDYEEGRSWGAAGPYEVVRGVVTFALDPSAPANQRITDIQFAEHGVDGLVRGESDFCILRPKDSAKANRGLFFSVANRGNVTLPFGLGPAPDLVSLPAGTIPSSESLLLYRGWTVAWCGWQFDLKRGPRQLAMTVPQALQNGKPIEGDFRIDLRATADSPSLRLLDGTAIMAGRTQPVYPPAGTDQPSATLTVRESPAGERTAIPRDQWRFAHESEGRVEPDGAHIWREGGFKAGEFYELVYRTAYCPVAGLGMAAVRDFVSYARSAPAAELGMAPIDRTVGMGVSQTGRFLRQYLHDGFNVDERGHKVFDGLFIHIAGGRTGEFNQRFAQPNEALAAGFADLPPRVWAAPDGGLLDRLTAADAAPKIFWVNSGWEYWRGDASLTHTTLDGTADIPNPANVRSYLMSGLDHLGANTAMARLMGIANEPTGVDPSPLLRALFANFDDWVSRGVEPPSSQVPLVSDVSAVAPEAVLAVAAAIPGAHRPDAEALPRVCEIFLGQDANAGIGAWPAEYGATHQTLVSAVDEDCNEIAGVRMPEQQVPVATLTGWNTPRNHTRLRQLAAMPGSRLNFARTAEERAATGDPRPSIAERYRDRDDYKARIASATDALIASRFIRPEDREFAITSAMRGYDAALSGAQI